MTEVPGPGAHAAWVGQTLHRLARVTGPPDALLRLDLGGLADRGPAIVAMLAADWACYARDRVDLPRLTRAVETFPAGFRLWYARRDGWTLPLGYTGWHPVSAETFRLGDVRCMVPLPAGPWLYVFNYSMIPPLHGTACTGRMLRALSADLDASRPAGLCAVPVSDAGERVAARFGMSRRGAAFSTAPPTRTP